MQKIEKIYNFKYYFYAFAASLAAGLLFVIPFYIKNGGIFYLGSDFVEQQIPFLTYCNQAFKEFNIWWSANIDLGTSFLGAFTFYVIGSPFFLVSLLFKPEAIYSAAGLLLVLKMGISGLTSFAYIKRYTKQNSWAIIASVAYTFCGFSISNMNFNHFYDVTALFPLCLLCLDLAVEKDKKGYFAVAVALSSLCNTVFFAGEVVFLILYFVVKLVSKEYKIIVKKFLHLALESLLGVGIAGVLLIPSVLSIINNPRVSNFYTDIPSMLFLKPIYWAEIIRGMLFPAECIFDRGFYLQGFTNSAELYLPLFSVVLVFAFMLAHKKSWITRLLLLCAVFAAIPILNSSFVMFNAEYYTRWLYMPILIMCLATAKALDDKSIKLRAGYIGYGAVWGLLGVVALLFIYYFKVTFIYNLMPVLFFVAVSLGGFVFVLFLRKIQALRFGAHLILAAVILVSAATGFVNSYYHSRTRDAALVKNYYTINSQISLPEEGRGYRIHPEYYFMNIGTMLNMPTATTFASNISASSFEFYEKMNIPRSVITSLNENDDKALLAFLSVKYRISLTRGTDDFPTDIFSTAQKMGNYSVAEYKNYLPMGLVYDSYITEKQFEGLTATEKQFALLHALVLSDEQIARYGNILSPAELDFINDLSDTALTEIVQKRSEAAAHYFEYTSYGALSKIALNEAGIALYTIPYDEGFSVYVNGQKAEYEKMDYGFIGLHLPKGTHEIQFKFVPKGFTIGAIISVISVLILIIYVLYAYFTKRKLIE